VQNHLEGSLLQELPLHAAADNRASLAAMLQQVSCDAAPTSHMPAGRPTVGINLAPSKTPTVKQQQAAAAARKQPPQQQAGAGSKLQTQHSIDDALHDLHELHLSPRSAAAAAAAAASDVSVHGSVTSEALSEASGAAGAAAAAAAAKSKVPWRPLSDYRMEADLAR
jgi:hypothetical protein